MPSVWPWAITEFHVLFLVLFSGEIPVVMYLVKADLTELTSLLPNAVFTALPGQHQPVTSFSGYSLSAFFLVSPSLSVT